MSVGSKPDNWNPSYPVYTMENTDARKTLEKLRSPHNQPDIVIFHSTYIPNHIRIANELRKRSIPYIIVPRGGMTIDSQKIKFLKKRIANFLFYSNYVDGAAAIHYLTKGEAEATKSWNTNHFIIGNGIDKKNPINDKQKREGVQFVFIGRLDIYHKGLDLLINGLALAKDDFAESKSKFELYGPDSNDSNNLLEKMILESELAPYVSLKGPVYDNEKLEVLKNTDVFVHTSRFEGHPMGVLEALSYGIPCLLTPGTNMSAEVVESGAGWGTEATEESIADTIKHIIINKLKIKEMKNCAILLSEDYHWNSIADKTLQAYANVIYKERTNDE